MSTLSVTLTGIAPATLTLELGTPGPQGSTGPAGPTGPAGSQGIPGVGVPAGGTAGQFLTKIDGTNYNTDWTTVNLAAYAPLASPLFTGDPRGPTAALGDNDTSLATTAFVQQELLSGTANAKNLEVYVRNQTGSTIPAGSIVYINGATGNRPTITLAQANNDANSAQTFGFVKTAIANNGTGYVIVRGELENINTSALTEGVQLYLSPTTAGTWTTTKPSAPQHLVYVGICVRAHPTQGVILVAVQNGYELPELHDIKITSPTNGQVLKYDSAQSLWVNGTDASGVAWGAITGTLTSQTDLNTALGLKYDASNPSGFITASALTPYLTSATAASTYQTISGMSSYLTTASAASTYQTQSGMSDYLAKAGNLSGLTNTGTARTNLGLGTIATVNDAPSDGSTYGRNNGAWVVAGGGGGTTWGSITGTLSSQTDLNTALGTKANLAGAQFTGKVGIGVAPDATAALKVDANGIKFGDGTTQTSAGYQANYPVTYFDGFTTVYLGTSGRVGASNSNPQDTYIHPPGLVIGTSGNITFADGTTQSTASTASNPPYTNAIWYGGAWYSAGVNSVTDGYGNYYNVLTI
jgi:hypothetical protein